MAELYNQTFQRVEEHLAIFFCLRVKHKIFTTERVLHVQAMQESLNKRRESVHASWGHSPLKTTQLIIVGKFDTKRENTYQLLCTLWITKKFSFRLLNFPPPQKITKPCTFPILLLGNSVEASTLKSLCCLTCSELSSLTYIYKSYVVHLPWLYFYCCKTAL